MYGGYIGQLLFVDLAGKSATKEALDEKMCDDFLGGYGFGVKILYDRMPSGVDALGKENMLGFTTGPLTGTQAISSPRFMVVGKSPLTGGWGEANCGGHFGPALKAAGYDAVFFSSIAEKPVYLLIDNGEAEIRDASDLWGKDTYETEEALKKIHGSKSQVACIGPAGEKKSLISCIITDKGRAAARSGLGAVMGSKNLKAVVVKGNGKIPVADSSRLKEAREKYRKDLEGDFAQLLTTQGTAGFTEFSVETGDCPVKNWGGSAKDFPGVAKIGGEAVNSLQEKKYGCYSCPIACGGLIRTPGSSELSHKVQYESIGAFGPMCLNDDLESIVLCNDICNRYGLDTISAGCTIAFAIECCEKGILTGEKTGGLELKWGNSRAIVDLTEKMARREGFGAFLADGSRKAAEQLGPHALEYAIQVGGQEIPMHDPRLFPGLLTTYISDPTPGRHTQGSETYVPPGLEVKSFEREEQAARGEVHKLLADLNHVFDAAGLCLFSFFALDYNSIPDFINAVTGWNKSFADLMLVGERISNLRHAFNLREGMNFWDIKIPGRLLGKPPLTEGPLAGASLDREALLTDYLKAMDWDAAATTPSRAMLKKLALDKVAKDLFKNLS